MGFARIRHPASVWYKYRWRWMETWWRQLWWRGRVYTVHPPPSITSLLLQISTLWEKKTIQPEERWFSQYFIIENKKGNLSGRQARLQWISYIWVGVFTNDNPSSIIITGPCCADVSHYGDKDVCVMSRQIIQLWTSAANRLIGEVVQSRRRPLLGPSPSWKRLLALSHLRHY